MSNVEDTDDKIELLYFIIENNLIDMETIEKNKDKIPQEVWDKVYGNGLKNVNNYYFYIS